MCNLFGLQKVETVGKTYMAVGGSRTFEKVMKGNRDTRVHHTVKTLNFAFEILDYVKKKTLRNGDQLRVKIGLHTGPVISGVVGCHKPQFSLIGDTVNRTARMCAKGDHNRIHISPECHDILVTKTQNF